MAINYTDKLKDPRWQKKRLEILDRDGWQCQVCFDVESTLHVHHRHYENCEPWDYDNQLLITLCLECHEKESANMKNNEQRLLKAIRKNFLSEEVGWFANSFEKMSLCAMPEVVASIYGWALIDIEIQKYLNDEYFKYIRKKNNASN